MYTRAYVVFFQELKLLELNWSYGSNHMLNAIAKDSMLGKIPNTPSIRLHVWSNKFHAIPCMGPFDSMHKIA